MEHHRFAGDLHVISCESPDLDRVEPGGRPRDRQLRDQVIAGRGLGVALHQDRLDSPRGRHVLLGAGNPAQEVLVVGDRVDPHAAVRRIVGRAVVPNVAHDVPSGVVGRTVRAGRVGEPEPVPHLVRDRSLVVISPGGNPRRAIGLGHSVSRERPAPAPGEPVEVGVEHQVDADEAREIHVGVGDGRAVAGRSPEVELEGIAIDVVGTRLGEVVPAVDRAAREVHVVVRELTPEVIKPWRAGSQHQCLKPRHGMRGDPRRVGEPAEDRRPRLRSADPLWGCGGLRPRGVELKGLHGEERQRPLPARGGARGLASHHDHAPMVDRAGPTKRPQRLFVDEELGGLALIIDQCVAEHRRHARRGRGVSVDDVKPPGE